MISVGLPYGKQAIRLNPTYTIAISANLGFLVGTIAPLSLSVHPTAAERVFSQKQACSAVAKNPPWQGYLF